VSANRDRDRTASRSVFVRSSAWLVRRLLPDDEAQACLGDLFEDLQESGSRRRFALQASSVLFHYNTRRFGRSAPRSQERKSLRMENLLMDVKFAIRALWKRPGFAAVVLVTLALGIGAATAIFSVVEGILLRPLPFADPVRLVAANETDGGDRMSFAWPNYSDMRDRAQSFEAIACHQTNAFNLVGEGPARRVNGRLVCAPFFAVLGVRMQAGRDFTPADDAVGAPPVMIVSDRFWKRDLGGDPAVLGRTLRTSELTFTVVGILPPDFRFSRPEDFYVPIGLTMTTQSGWHDRGNHFGLNAVARLKSGVSPERADAELKAIAEDLKRAYPNTNARNGAAVVPLHDRFVDQVSTTLQTLMAAVGFLLLLAYVNVASLFVARGAARQHELAIRSALGSGRGRIVRQLLAESTLLSLAGGVLGVGIAFWLLRLLITMAPEGIPRIEEVALNRASLIFAVSSSLIFGLIFGTFPALQASSLRGTQMVTRASRSNSAAPRRTRRVLMAVEVALALILLTGCGLMARTMMRLNAVDPGFDPAGLATARVVLSGERWTPPRRVVFYDAVLEEVRRIPGVTSAALTLSLPIEGSNWGSVFVVRDKPAPPRPELPSAAMVPISRGYFQTMGIKLVAGREFQEGDKADGREVMIVNETLARRIWPGEDPLGKFFKQGWPETPETVSPWREVVGVVRDIKLDGVDQDVPMQAYVPLVQAPSRSVAVVARTSGAVESVLRPLEAAVQRVDPELPVTGLLPMTELMRNAIARQRLSTVIFAVFAAVALLLAAVGLASVVSQSVTERTREIGVRMALGSARGAVVRLFVLHGVATAAAGTVVGLAGAFLLSRWMETLLFEIKPADPLTFGVVAAALLIVAAGACYIPARRAAHLDPLEALRGE
jgi:putative ABC transport system permease protein